MYYYKYISFDGATYSMVQHMPHSMVQHINLKRTDDFVTSVVFRGDKGFFVNVIFSIIARIFYEDHLKAKQQIADFE